MERKPNWICYDFRKPNFESEITHVSMSASKTYHFWVKYLSPEMGMNMRTITPTGGHPCYNLNRIINKLRLNPSVRDLGDHPVYLSMELHIP